MKVSRTQSAAGFTLIELLVVIALACIILALGASGVGKLRCAAQNTTVTKAILACKNLASTVDDQEEGTSLMHCAWTAMTLAKEMKDKDWWEDNKKKILELWTTFRDLYNQLRALHPDWGMAALPADPSDGPPSGFPSPPPSNP